MARWILADRSCKTTNVLCCGLSKGGLAKHASNLVSSLSWDILLHRIGDLLMCYILRHSSVFLPVRKSDYLQVTGVPLNIVLQKRISASTMARNQQSRSINVKCHWGLDSDTILLMVFHTKFRLRKERQGWIERYKQCLALVLPPPPPPPSES